MTESERREWIRRRAKEDPYWRIVHALGSLRLALLLLVTIAVACAVATVYESKFNTEVAQTYFYKAPWFLIWLGVLCVNLAAAAMTRWPWQRKHTGFLVTHAGIIVLLIGAMIGMLTGFEANVTLRKGQPPVERLVLNETVLQVNSPLDGAMYLMPFPVERPAITPDSPRTLPLPDTDARLLVDQYTEALAEVPTLEPSPGGHPGARLTFRGGMAGRDVPVRLLVSEDGSPSEYDFFGMATIRLRERAESNDLRPASTEAAGEDAVTRETHVVFADAMPVVHTHGGPPGRLAFRLSPESGDADTTRLDGWMLLARHEGGQTHGFSLPEVLRKEATLGGYRVEVLEFWPDFEMRDGIPRSASDEIRKPAVLVRVTGRDVAVDATGPMLDLFPARSEDTLAYRLTRAGEVVREGEARVGDQVATGWGDWTFTVDEYLPRAAEGVSLRPVEDDPPENALPAIRARLLEPDGHTGQPVWIRSGRAEEVFGRDMVLFAGFGLKTQPVPFSVQLDDFRVPRDEGTDTPADFIATIRFTDSGTGETVVRTSRMNHPASYPGAWWNVITGLNYKFSQASWNPDDLGETTLQVLYDPGWLFKWVGSLMICCGIFILFYFKPYARRKPAESVDPVPTEHGGRIPD